MKADYIFVYGHYVRFPLTLLPCDAWGERSYRYPNTTYSIYHPMNYPKII
jgi:hypothetical protein